MFAALALLTPFGRRRAASAEAVPWLPVLGLLLGLAVGGLWWAAAQGWPLGVAAALALLADLALTGWRHLASLAEATRRQRVAVAAAPAVLLLRWTALASLHPSVVLIGGIWCASRAWMVALAGLHPAFGRFAGFDGTQAAGRPGEDGGDSLAGEGWPPPEAATHDGNDEPAGSPVRAWSVAVLGVSAGMAVASIWHGVAGPVAVLAGTVVAAGAWMVIGARQGEDPDDLLFAVCVVGETAALVIASARW